MIFTLPLSLIVYPLVGILIYWPCLNGEWIFDDKLSIETAQNHFKWSWKWLVGGGQYRPLTLISLALNNLWPGTRRSLHVTNVFIHAGTAFLVEHIAMTQGADHVSAFLCGLLCLIHPFGANSVGYIAARASILSGLCGVAAALAVLAGVWPLSIPLLAASFLAKEDGIAFGPLVVGVAAISGLWLAAICISLCGLALLLQKRNWFLEFLTRDGSAVMATAGLPIAHEQPWNALSVAVENIGRYPMWCFGLGQSPYHGSGIPLPSCRRKLLALFIAANVYACAMTFPWTRLPLLLIFVGPWLVYILCPVPEQVAEYRNYASVAGFALFLAPIFDAIPYNFIVWTVVLAGFAVMTVGQARNWAGPLGFWTAAASNTSGDPSRAFGEIGVYWKMKGELLPAEFSLREAVRLNPNFGPAMDNLANVLFDKGQKTEAIAQMEHCMVQCPNYSNGWESLGRLYELSELPDMAFAAYHHGLTMDGSERFQNRLGLLAYQQKKYEVAGEWFDKALKRQPNSTCYRHNRAVIAVKEGNPAKARELVECISPYAFVPNEMIPPEVRA